MEKVIIFIAVMGVLVLTVLAGWTHELQKRNDVLIEINASFESEIEDLLERIKELESAQNKRRSAERLAVEASILTHI